MAESASIGSSVEGEKLHLSTRKFFTPPPRRCPKTRKIQHLFRLSIHGAAEVAQEYEVPDQSVVYLTSFTAQGDRVHGSMVSGWALKALGPPNVKSLTGTHSGTVLQVSGGCLAQVEASPREHLESADIQSRHPPVKQILR
jgi:hypothetical protein